MRSALGAGILLLALTGCTRWGMLKPEQNTAPPPGSTPSVVAIVKYLDDNAARIQTVRSTDLDITCSLGLQSFGLRGKMIAQKPRNFLMGADSLGKRMVDLGSNDQEFWFWISKNDPPYQFYCSYKDLAGGRVRQMPLPFQPDWVVDALGMGNYGPADRYKMETEADKLKLVEMARSPQGQPVRKVIVLNGRPVRAPTPQVVAFLLIDDASNKEICSAHITETLVDHDTGAIVPRRIEFRWTLPNNQKFKMAMRLGELNVNPPIAAAAFVRRPLQGVPSYDLATGRTDQPTAFQRLQGAR
jgi:hypothetical protein